MTIDLAPGPNLNLFASGVGLLNFFFNNYNYMDCKCNFKWPSMKNVNAPILKDTLGIFVRSSMH